MTNSKNDIPNYPEYHREMLNGLIDKLKNENLSAGSNYERFIKSLFDIFGDKPPRSWRFFKTIEDGYPIFQVINKKTGRLNDFLRVRVGSTLVISHKYFDEKYRAQFPKQRDFYGQGDAVQIDFGSFDKKVQQIYIDAIKQIVENRKELISINYDVV